MRLGSALLRWLKETLALGYPPVRFHRKELHKVLKDHERMGRCLPPEVESACGKASRMFLLRSFSGEREAFYVDTSRDAIIPYRYARKYSGKREHIDLEIK